MRSRCDNFSTSNHHDGPQMSTNRIQLKCVVHLSQIHQDWLHFCLCHTCRFDVTVFIHASPFPTVIATPSKCFACLPLHHHHCCLWWTCLSCLVPCHPSSLLPPLLPCLGNLLPFLAFLPLPHAWRLGYLFLLLPARQCSMPRRGWLLASDRWVQILHGPRPPSENWPRRSAPPTRAPIEALASRAGGSSVVLAGEVGGRWSGKRPIFALVGHSESQTRTTCPPAESGVCLAGQMGRKWRLLNLGAPDCR